jgi:aspartate/methionine/tyrosine aminotransferase
LKPLADNALRAPGSGIRKIMNMALTMEGVRHLEVGEPDFPSPPNVIEAACEAARSGYTKYTANAGIPSLREAITEKLLRVNGDEVSPERITVTNGAVSGLMASIMTVAQTGDDVLLPDPGWPNYTLMCRALGVHACFYPLRAKNGFLPDPEELVSLITPRTKAVVVNTPSNPTGAVFPEVVVRQIVEVADRHDLWIVSDEVYEQIIFEGSHVSPARFDEARRVIRAFSFSKTYAMTGWRIGYIVSPPGVTEVINKLQEALISCAGGVNQKAAEAALRGPQNYVAEMRSAYHRRRDLLVHILHGSDLLAAVPHGAFYAMLDVSSATEDTYEFARRLLLDEAVAVAPGETFGPSGRGLVRIALCAAEETIQRGVEAIVHEVASAARLG